MNEQLGWISPVAPIAKSSVLGSPTFRQMLQIRRNVYVDIFTAFVAR